MSGEILMPILSAGMEEGAIANWLKSEGDTIAPGDVIAEIETDKATMEFEVEQGGVLAKILVDAGTLVAVNTPIAVLSADGELPADFTPAAPAASRPESPAANGTTASDPSPVPAIPTHTPQPDRAANGSVDRPRSSPLARRIAHENAVGLDGLEGSGPYGRIVRIDVERAIAATDQAPAQTVAQAQARTHSAVAPASTQSSLAESAEHERVPNSTMRKTIARRLAEAKSTIPHFYLNAEIEIDALLELRKTLNDQSDGQYKLTINDLIVKAAALALRRVPEVNAAWTDDAILLYENVDISIAVSTEGGLITPILRNADKKGLATISAETSDLAERARSGGLRPEEFQGGSFTISNLGMFGIDSFSAIINPPQSCILAVGAGVRKPVIRDDVCVPATIMTCTLSVDHRSVDGVAGAQYLAAFRKLIENPMQLIL